MTVVGGTLRAIGDLRVALFRPSSLGGSGVLQAGADVRLESAILNSAYSYGICMTREPDVRTIDTAGHTLTIGSIDAGCTHLVKTRAGTLNPE